MQAAGTTVQQGRLVRENWRERTEASKRERNKMGPVSGVAVSKTE